MKKKILILASFPAPYRVDVFKGLAEQYDVDVFFGLTNDNARNKEYLSTKELFHYFIVTNKEDKIYFQKCIKNLKHYDLVLAYDWYLPFALRVEQRCIRLNVKYIVNCDGAFDIEKSGVIGKIKKVIKSHFIKNAAGCFGSGQYARKYFEYYGAKPNSIYLHNFTSLHREDIYTRLISDIEKTKIKDELKIKEEKVVISVGRMINSKGFDVLIEAFRDFSTDTGLYIVGGQPLKEYVELINKYKLDNVHFIDHVDKFELKKYYLASDLFILMTRGDTWGLVINEALANGLPVITTDKCVAGRELIKDGVNGYIVPTDSREQLIQRSEVILNDKSFRGQLAQNALNSIQDYFIESVILNHINIIEKKLQTKFDENI